jgi:hypothetical protein
MVCLLRLKDCRLTTAWIFPQQVKGSVKSQGGKLKPASRIGVKNAGGCQERYLLVIFARICKKPQGLDEKFQFFVFFFKFLRTYVTSCFFSKAMPPLAFPIWT